MRRHTVAFKPEAQAQLAELFRFVATAASPTIAQRFTDGIVAYCNGLATFPYRGTARDDLRSGLRMISYRKRTVITFVVEPQRVVIIGIFYGGQNWETAFSS